MHLQPLEQKWCIATAYKVATTYVVHSHSNNYVCYSSCSTVLGPGIACAALLCGSRKCPTDNMALETPVRITIGHSDAYSMVCELICFVHYGIDNLF